MPCDESWLRADEARGRGAKACVEAEARIAMNSAPVPRDPFDARADPFQRCTGSTPILH